MTTLKAYIREHDDHTIIAIAIPEIVHEELSEDDFDNFIEAAADAILSSHREQNLCDDDPAHHTLN